jgi:ubiquinone/menaquinone biosynthesis C-methylase UbiE
MNSESMAASTIGKIFIRLLARAMESRFRYRFFAPEKILGGVAELRGQAVLELGCGTGFFTLPAARMIGDRGHLVAMDILEGSVALVSGKVKAAGLRNVRVVRGDALATGLEGGGFAVVVLFGVVPAPMLPLSRLLPEVHRLLMPGGNLAVWPPVPGWLPRSVLASGLFTFSGKRNGVFNFKRC